MNDKKTLVVGLTGQTGAGKSTLSRLFAGRGTEIIDADAVARQTTETSTECLMDLVLEFSTEVIHPDATLNREKLAAICFGNRQKLRRLNEITFPYIIEAIAHKLEEARERGVTMVLLDAPTLYESGLDARCDRVVAVLAEKETRVRRIIARDDLTEEAALRRVNAQNADAFYTDRADEIITNNEDAEALRFSFTVLYGKLEDLLRDGSFAAAREKTPPPPTEAEADAAGFEELTSQSE